MALATTVDKKGKKISYDPRNILRKLERVSDVQFTATKFSLPFTLTPFDSSSEEHRLSHHSKGLMTMDQAPVLNRIKRAL